MIYKQLSEFQHCVPIPSCQSINQSFSESVAQSINQGLPSVPFLYLMMANHRALIAHIASAILVFGPKFLNGTVYKKRERANELERTDPISRAVHRLNTAVVCGWVGGEGANSPQPRERASLGFLPWLRRTSTAAQNADPPGCSSLFLSIALRRSAHNCWCIFVAGRCAACQIDFYCAQRRRDQGKSLPLLAPQGAAEISSGCAKVSSAWIYQQWM